ncbi:MAG TPA: hypothetical protein VMD30_10520, partial [Tepidisphaeraceae bacterium]|nr:hypothetical protein [Tepidisphaeraceae bacterium]
MTKRPPRFSRRRLAWAAIAVMLSAPYAHADAGQPGGPVVVNAQRAISPLNLQPVTGSLDLDDLYQRDTDKEANTPTTSSTENSILETLNAQTEGNIFNPDFITFSAGGTFGLEQDFYGGTNGSAHGNDNIEGWDLSATALPNSNNPLTVFSRQTVSFFNPVFSPTLRDTDNTYGANTTLVNSFGTSQLSYSHQNDNQTETGGITEYELHQDNATWHTNFLTAPNQSLTFDYDYQNTSSQELSS